jgi:Bacterial Ig-like domain (group 2)
VRNDITALAIEPDHAVLKNGEAVQLNLYARTKRAGTDLIPGTMAAWSSDDNRVGEVNGQGRLTARGAGLVTITASYADRQVTSVFTVVD